MLVALVLLAAGCDDDAPTAGRAPPASPVAPAPAPTPVARTGSGCPAADLAGFVAAFADSPALQKAFTAPVVDTAYVDWNAQPEPAESVEPVLRDLLRFPVMPSRARQRADGLQYREIGSNGDLATIVLEVPGTDLQLRYTFRRDRCWTLVKIVDPAFGKTFAGDAPAAGGLVQGAHADARSDEMPAQLSAEFGDCMARAGSQRIPRAACLTDERDRQQTRLDHAYQMLLGRLEGDRRNRLVEAQRLWVETREKDRGLETPALDAPALDALGPMGHLQSLEADARAIAERAGALERDLDTEVP